MCICIPTIDDELNMKMTQTNDMLQNLFYSLAIAHKISCNKNIFILVQQNFHKNSDSSIFIYLSLIIILLLANGQIFYMFILVRSIYFWVQIEFILSLSFYLYINVIYSFILLFVCLFDMMIRQTRTKKC